MKEIRQTTFDVIFIILLMFVNYWGLLGLLLQKISIIKIPSLEGIYFSEKFATFSIPKISHGSESKASQIASRVEKRIALAFHCFKIERLAGVILIFSESS